MIIERRTQQRDLTICLLDKGEKSLDELKAYENIQTRTVRNKYRKLTESGKKGLEGKMQQ